MMVGLAALAPAVPAGADAPGTVKIVVNGDELVKQPGNVDNDPHVDCGFHIVFNGFESLKGQSVTANIQIQSPSAPVDHSIFMTTGTISQSGYLDIPVTAGMLNFLGTVANHTENGNNDSDKADTADPNEITYHVTLDTSTTVGGDKIAKQKTFWIGGCEASPTIATQVSSAAVTLGSGFTDSATLSGLSTAATPTGTVTFAVFGPNNADCSGAPLSTSSGSITSTGPGTATATSGVVTPTAVGTYRFIATYAGDANNNSALGVCNADHEAVVVTAPIVAKASPTIATQVSSAAVTLGSGFTDSATLSGLSTAATPTGTVTFAVFGPDDVHCTGNPLSTSSGSVTSTGPGTATATSGVVTPTAVGTYRFIATYAGDANNNSALGVCNADHESVVVSAPGNGPGAGGAGGGGAGGGGGLQPGATPTPSVTVVKTNDAGGNPFAKANQAKAPSDPVDFQAVITNTSSETETITAIADQFGELTPAECPGLIGTVLAPGQSVTCSFTIADYAPPAGGSLTNRVTVNVKDTSNQVASATDTSTVTSPPAVEATGGTQQRSVTPPAAAPPAVTPPPVVVTPPPAAAVLPVTASRTLPFTGANVWQMFLTGLGLLLVGVALWLKTYRVPGARHYA